MRSVREGSVAGVVLAGGSGTRMTARSNKAFIPLAGRRLVSWSLNSLARLPEVGPLVLVVREEDRALAEEVLDREVPARAIDLVIGGTTRHRSEMAALEHLRPDISSGRVSLVLTHDAARPLVTLTLIRSVVATAVEFGASVPALLDDDIVEIDEKGRLAAGSRRRRLVRAQTPQVFDAAELLAAFDAAQVDGFDGPDTSSCVERYSDMSVHWVEGDPRNLKVTYPQDLFVAERLLAAANFEIV
ncbi:MAG: IspD/TarI family cytidylyltransferase [Actinomycetes bacterium]